MTITNKLLLIFKDSADKEVVISIPKVDNYSVTLEQKADDIAQTILLNKACLNLDIVSLKKIDHEQQSSTPIIKDGERV